MEMAAKVGTELALSGLFRVVSILDENFRYVITTEEMKHLNDFVDYKIVELIREAKSNDLVELMPLLEKLQAAALELEDLLDLYEYDQIENQVNSSSSEPITKEKTLPKHLRDGLNKLLMIVEGMENIRPSQALSRPWGKATEAVASGLRPAPPSGASVPKTRLRANPAQAPCDSFIDFLVGGSHVARPEIKLALSDISRAIQTLGSNLNIDPTSFSGLEQVKDVVSYHIQALIRYVKSDDLAAQSKQLQKMLKAASLELVMLDQYDYIVNQPSSSFSNPTEKFESIFSEKLVPNLSKSPLRIGLENLLKFVVGAETNQQLIPCRVHNTQAPTLRIGVEKWLKFVEQVEKEHPFITSKTDTAQLLISTEFLPLRGLLSVMSLENVKCQEDAEEIMRYHKKIILNKVIFGWTDNPSRIDTCEEVLERLEPHVDLQKLSIIGYSSAKFPKWMVKENWLPCLQTLELRSCRSLKIISFLPSHLRELDVHGCHELMQLPPLSDTLLTLKLSNCLKLMQLPPLSDTLQELDVHGCHELMQLPPLSDTLRTLVLSNCPKLTPPSMFNKSPGLCDLSFLINLVYLELKELPCLHTLTNLSPTVDTLVVKDCPKLTSLGNLQCCTSLQNLEVSRCPKITSLENLQRCTSLQELTILRCPMLVRKEPLLVIFQKRKKRSLVQGDIGNRFLQLQHIETDEPFMVLDLFQQHAFSSVKFIQLYGVQGPFIRVYDEYFRHFSFLSDLRLRECTALPNLEKLSTLQRLGIEDCPDVESLPDLPVSLRSIKIRDCPKLKEKYKEGSELRNTISHIDVLID